MQVSKVLAGLAVSDLERAKRWYQTFFNRPADAEPMPGLADWRIPGGVVQLVVDQQRAGGSLVTLWVPDARRALDDLAARGGPSVDLDEVTSDKVLFATFTDPDGNAITVVEVRESGHL
jgi:predicted enzyme related to lactoylglutathione lyase